MAVKLSWMCWVQILTAYTLMISLASGADACRSRTSWCRYAMPCSNDSKAVLQHQTQGEHICLLQLNNAMNKQTLTNFTDDLVAQLNYRTGVCSIFHYQDVCRLLQTRGVLLVGPLNKVPEDCLLYRSAAFVNCNASLNSRLLGVWLAGGRNRLSNLVCQSDPNNYRMVSVNITWSDEGAVFNGNTSYALMNNSQLVAGDTRFGFTWLMRVKRQPGNQPFMELVSCNHSINAHHLWEHNGVSNLFFRSPVNVATTNYPVLPNSQDWIDIGASVNETGSSVSIYANGFFVPNITIDSKEKIQLLPCYHMTIGRRLNSQNFMNGTVRLVAVGNGSLTLQEMRDIFALIP